jgi:hypothetical protein
MSRLGLILPGSEEFSLPTSLEEIADLSPADDDFVQHKSGAWANRTVAQSRTTSASPMSNCKTSSVRWSQVAETNIDVTYDDTNARYNFIAQRNGAIGPADHGLLAWSFDPIFVSSGAALTSGATRVTLLHLPRPATVTNIHAVVSGAGSGLTAGQSFAALYGVNNTLLGITADQSVAWTSTGEKVMPLTTPYVASSAGLMKVVLWSVGSSPPSFVRELGNALTANFGMSAPPYRAATADTGLTTTAPDPLGTQTATVTMTLVGLS